MKETRANLLEAARDLFALNGYDATSTRAIAQKAGVNISAIVYYFGSKLGLYTEILKEISFSFKKELKEKIERAQTLINLPKTTKEEATDSLYALISECCSLLLSDRLSKEDLRIFLFEYNVSGKSPDVLYPELISPIYHLFSNLLIKASNNSLAQEEATLYTFQLFSQMFVFKARKETVLKCIGWKKYGEEEINKIIASVLNQTRAILMLHQQ